VSDLDLVEDVRRAVSVDASPEELANRAAEVIRNRTGRRWVGVSPRP